MRFLIFDNTKKVRLKVDCLVVDPAGHLWNEWIKPRDESLTCFMIEIVAVSA